MKLTGEGKMKKSKNNTFDFSFAYWITIFIIIQLSFNFFTTLVFSLALANLHHNTIANFQIGWWQIAGIATSLISFIYAIAALVLMFIPLVHFSVGRQQQKERMEREGAGAGVTEEKD